jgi:hypothetical protein
MADSLFHQLGREGGEPLNPSVGNALDQNEVLAIDVAKLTHRLLKDRAHELELATWE